MRYTSEECPDEIKLARHTKRLSRLKFLSERLAENNLHKLSDAIADTYGEVEVDAFFMVLRKWLL